MQTLSRSAGSGSVRINTVALGGVCAALAFVLGWQFALDARPCPLCLLQRVAFVMAGVGLLLNVRFGPSSLHYSAVLIAAVAGLALAGAPAFLPAEPGGSGPLLLGLPLHAWAFLAFGALLAYCAVMLALDRKWGDNAIPRPASLAGGLVMWLFLALALAHLALAVLECGPGTCPDRPVAYLWFRS